METFLAIWILLDLLGVVPKANSWFNIFNSWGEVLLLLRLANGALSIDGSCSGKVASECEINA